MRRNHPGEGGDLPAVWRTPATGQWRSGRNTGKAQQDNGGHLGNLPRRTWGAQVLRGQAMDSLGLHCFLLTFIPSLVALVEGVMYLSMSEARFLAKYPPFN